MKQSVLWLLLSSKVRQFEIEKWTNIGVVMTPGCTESTSVGLFALDHDDLLVYYKQE